DPVLGRRQGGRRGELQGRRGRHSDRSPRQPAARLRHLREFRSPASHRAPEAHPRRGRVDQQTPGEAMRHARASSLRLVVAAALWACSSGASQTARADGTAEQWGIYEIALDGPSGGNPFTEVDLSARFSQGDEAVTVPGFYDGDGTYRARFMP